MKLQEDIDRIKEVMGILNEDLSNSFKRRFHNIDGLIPLVMREVKDRDSICKYTIENYVEAVTYNTIDHMYWNFFSSIDDDSEEWTEMFRAMEKYIFDKFGQDLRVDWQINCQIRKSYKP